MTKKLIKLVFTLIMLIVIFILAPIIRGIVLIYWTFSNERSKLQLIEVLQKVYLMADELRSMNNLNILVKASINIIEWQNCRDIFDVDD